MHVKHLAHTRCSTNTNSLPLPMSFLDKFRPGISTMLPHWFFFPIFESLIKVFSIHFPLDSPSNITPQILKIFFKASPNYNLHHSSCVLYFPLYILLENKANQKISLLWNWDLEAEETKMWKDPLHICELRSRPKASPTPLPPLHGSFSPIREIVRWLIRQSLSPSSRSFEAVTT